MADQQTTRALLRIQELLQRGMLDAAEALGRQLIQAVPQQPDAWFALGAIYLRKSDNGQAEAAFRQAIALQPASAAFWNELSIALIRLGRTVEAEAAARQAMALDPNAAASWLNLANALFAQRRWAEAAPCYQKSVQIDPRNPAAWNNLAGAEQRLGNFVAAQKAYEQSLALAPNHLGALANYACFLFERGEQERSVQLLTTALHNAPPTMEALLLLGFAFMRLGKYDEAEIAYRRAVAFEPHHREAGYNLALVLEQKWSLLEAETLIRQVLADYPDYADAWALLSGLEQAQGRMDESLVALNRSVEFGPDPGRHSRLVHGYQYANDADPRQLLAVHRKYDALYALPLLPAVPVPKRPHGGNRPLRLGFVSADFRQHPTSFLVLPALEHLDKSRCSIACYADQIHEDSFAARFRAIADTWHSTLDLSPAEIAALVRQDEIDILVDLMGHTGKNQLLVFAPKPAPMQVTWFGYVGTTGLSAMDYLLADRFHVRPGEEGAYAESVLRMPHGYACYQAPDYAPPVAPLPALATGYITFGCFNSPGKFAPRTFDAWAEVLRGVPTSKLLLKFGGLDAPRVQTWLAEQFSARGIAADRILMEGWSEHPELLAAYDRVDIALDTQPYSGGLTTCEALWMGVPTITYPGKTFASRHATSHMSNAGYEQFVAQDVAGFVELAIEWAGRITDLAAIRSQMRDTIHGSPLCDAPTFANDLLSLLTTTFQSHTPRDTSATSR